MKNKTKNTKKISGIIRVSSKPIGFITHEDGKDIVIYEESLNCALDKDEVEVEIIHKNKDVIKGRVTKVLKRNKTEFVGIIEESPFGFVFKADDWRFYKRIDLSIVPKEVRVGEKILVKLESWTNPNLNPKGTILKVIGKKGEHETEMQSILLERGIVYDFPIEVEKEAKTVAEDFERKIKNGKYGDRKDFRDITTFTIDPIDAKDFDDALSYKEIDEKTIEVGVHIADVSYFVRPGSALDTESRKRLFSVYLVDRTIPMLPEVLSNDLCSLNPNLDRYAFAAVFKIKKETGEIVDRWFGKTLINSDKRFSYEEAQEVLDNFQNDTSSLAGAGTFVSSKPRSEVHFGHILTTLNNLANIYREQNKKEGAIEFETDEVKFELDKDGKPIRVYRKQRLDTMKMIEEWMLLANKEVAKFIASKIKNGNGASIYRIHDLPNVDKLEELSIFVRALGYELPIKNGIVKAKDLNSLLSALKGHSAESLVRTAAVRSMSKAIYSTKNIGHFGLAFEYYTHFTSPIRRYPDLVIHRILLNHLNGGKIGKDEYAKFQNISLEASEKEVKVQEAERDSIKYKQVEYMQSKVGQSFECTISGVTEWGMYLEEPESKAEGLVRLRDMEGDTFELDAKNYRIVGTVTKKKYTLGDKVKAKLLSADLDRKTLDFKLV